MWLIPNGRGSASPFVLIGVVSPESESSSPLAEAS